MRLPMRPTLIALVLASMSMTACSSAGSEEEAASSDSDLVIRPNGTADIATITFRPPPGFAMSVGATEFGGERGAWVIGLVGDLQHHYEETPLVPGQALRLSAGPHRINAHFYVTTGETAREAAGEQLLTVQAKAGFDTAVTFGTLRVKGLPARHLLAGHGAGIILDDVDYTPMVRRSGETRYEYLRPGRDGRGSTATWDFGAIEVPLPDGDYQFDYNALSLRNLTASRKFTISSSSRVEIDAAVAAPALFTFSFERAEPPEFPDAAVATKLLVSCEADQWARDRSHQSAQVVPGQRLGIYTGAAPRRCRWDQGPVGPTNPFIANPGGTVTAKVPRIEIDDVFLADAQPPVSVPGTYTVQSDVGGGRWSAAAGPYPTRTGLDLAPGTYRVTVAYKTPFGQPKSLTYPVTL